MFPRFWRSNQIILSAISGGSLEKLTCAVTYWRAICFLRFRLLFFCRGEVFRVFWGVPGFLGGVPGFFGLFLVFLGVPGFSGVPECFVMFRCSGVPCSGVPGSTTCNDEPVCQKWKSPEYSGPKNLAKFQESLHWHNGKHRRFSCVDAL